MEMSPELFARLAKRFAALGDPNRLRIVNELQAGPCRVGEVAERVQMAQSSVSKHLATLREAGLVASERQGNEVLYHVSDAMLFQLCELVCNSVRAQALAEAQALGIHPT